MSSYLFCLPFFYFLKTRLNTKAAVLFHGYAEFLLGVLLLIYAGTNPIQAVTNFVLAYFAFISVYEIGYIVNDYVSVRFEKNPRKRLKGKRISNMTVFAWIAVRVVVFLLLTFYLNSFNSVQWWLFYFTLIIAFCLHNLLRQKELKIFTFISLAFLRFYAPLFPFLAVAFFISSINGILLFYVFFRTLTYIDSKGLLVIPSRASLTFKTTYYLLLIPVSAVTFLFTKDMITLWLNLYFLFFWAAFYFARLANLVSKDVVK